MGDTSSYIRCSLDVPSFARLLLDPWVWYIHVCISSFFKSSYANFIVVQIRKLPLTMETQGCQLLILSHSIVVVSHFLNVQ